MRVLIACEFSGIVRDAFLARGADTVSCDILPSERPGPHLQCDVKQLLTLGWDLMIAFPPCTYLCSSGARWHYLYSQTLQHEALQFVYDLLDAPINKIALENPIGVISNRIRKPDQIIQPYHFGHEEKKATCLWLKNLPRLNATTDLVVAIDRVHKESPGDDRWKRRSRTLQGIADAMADQWCK